MTVDGADGAGDADYVMRLVRERDITRYFADLYAPAGCRPHILALHALNAEISNIPASVVEPHLGDIRFQWWRDEVVRAADPEHIADTPVMRTVLHAIRENNLPVSALADLIDARRSDLYGDPIPTLRDLEGYYGETDAALFQLVCLVLGSRGAETADASGHAGIAFGLARQLTQFSLLRRQGRQIASSDLLEIYGLDGTSLFAEKPPEGAAELIVHLANLASGHFDHARAAIRSLPSRLQTAFLPLATVPATIDRIRKDPARLMIRPLDLSNLSILVRIFRAAVVGV